MPTDMIAIIGAVTGTSGLATLGYQMIRNRSKVTGTVEGFSCNSNTSYHHFRFIFQISNQGLYSTTLHSLFFSFKFKGQEYKVRCSVDNLEEELPNHTTTRFTYEFSYPVDKMFPSNTVFGMGKDGIRIITDSDNIDEKWSKFERIKNGKLVISHTFGKLSIPTTRMSGINA